MTGKSISLDEVRAKNPELSFSLYAFAGEPVALEVITPDDQIFRFDGPTEAAVLEKAFPVPDDPVVENDDILEPTPSIFD